MENYLKAVLYGIVEGITEWLPVSSTGHMILLHELFPMEVSQEFWDMFLVVIQFGAILAVILLSWKTIWPVGVVRHRRRRRLALRRETFLLWGKVLTACIPAGVIGVFADDWLDAHLYNWQVVSVMLILVGVAFLIVEHRNRDMIPTTTSMESLSFRQAMIIGLFQLIAAVLPGTSRSGATIIGALLIGISRTVAAEFTFILAIPVMAGASLLKLLKHGPSFSTEELIILGTGMLVAFIVSILVIRFLMAFIKQHDFKPFGWYRVILGAVVITYFGLLAR
ncbi:undecaprenyl-diphosphate phosphatase [Lachnoclostridium sp. Marseille-P6806]|uniref:undecaprenyl-diphosphate phosphatase n=1 Tax=Lachnoclostridium sp. Marseille-P6806 TaxID=2364793 RepID=UPI0010315846|nr:undecaprenyl-diphosphate phosphatase [Lachnoclostridium sp. Marseille-P6806]